MTSSCLAALLCGALVFSAAASEAASDGQELCPPSGDADVAFPKVEFDQIRAAVAWLLQVSDCSHPGRPSPKEHHRRGDREVRTLVYGDCSVGGGEIFWVRKDARGWRVLKSRGPLGRRISWARDAVY